MMAGPEPSQQAHAQRIRELTAQRREDARASPEAKLDAQIAAAVTRLLPAAVAAEFAKVQITGVGCTISGKFPNLNISVNPPAARTLTAIGEIDCTTDPPTVTITINN